MFFFFAWFGAGLALSLLPAHLDPLAPRAPAINVTGTVRVSPLLLILLLYKTKAALLSRRLLPAAGIVLPIHPVKAGSGHWNGKFRIFNGVGWFAPAGLQGRDLGGMLPCQVSALLFGVFP